MNLVNHGNGVVMVEAILMSHAWTHIHVPLQTFSVLITLTLLYVIFFSFVFWIQWEEAILMSFQQTNKTSLIEIRSCFNKCLHNRG